VHINTDYCHKTSASNSLNSQTVM